MSRRIAIAALVALVAAGSPGAGTAATLDLENGPQLFSIPVSYVFGTSAVDGQDLDAWGAGFGFQQVGSGGRWSFGAAVSYIAGETSGPVEGIQSDLHYRTVPVTIVGRGYFVPPGHGWNAYAGAGFGVGFNRVERTTDTAITTSYGSSVSFQLPVGFLIALTDDLVLEVGYSFLWLDDSFLDGDYANQVLLALTLPS